MVTVKICGLRTREGAEADRAAGADFAGLLFVPGRRRSISMSTARKLLPHLGAVEAVGVFLDAPLNEVRQISQELDLSTVQLHGSEPASYAERLAQEGLRVIRAVESEHATFDHLHPFQASCHAFIVDGPAPGSGIRARGMSSGALARLSEKLGHPIWLAGGLSPENVAEALDASGAQGADVASGVERAGRQDPDRIRRFVEATRRQRVRTP